MLYIAKTAVLIPLVSLLFGLQAQVGFSGTHRAQALRNPSELSTAESKAHNPAFTISAESVLQKLTERQEVYLIDVRGLAAFQKFRIPGSMHMSLFAIKTKGFLKAKPVVLVNEGYPRTPLERECEHLRRLGFRAWILHGGLNYWREKGALLEGDVFAQPKLNRVSPAALFVEKDYRDNLVIDASVSKHLITHPLIPQAISLPFDSNGQRFAEALKATLVKLRHSRFSSLMICNQKGEHYDRIEKLLENNGIKNVFFLEGGLDAYQEFLELQRFATNARHRSQTTLKKCPSCP